MVIILFMSLWYNCSYIPEIYMNLWYNGYILVMCQLYFGEL